MMRRRTNRDGVFGKLSVILVFVSVVVGILITLVSFDTPQLQIVAVATSSLLLIFALAAIRGTITLKNITLTLWVLLISHRALILRAQAVTVSSVSLPDIFAEVAITGFVFLCSLLLGIVRLGHDKILRLSKVQSCLTLYALFALVSLAWAPNRLYAVFWLMRLLSAVILIILYFERAGEQEYRRFATATLIGMLPHVALPLIAFFVFGAFHTLTRRVAGFWFHPASASILAFSVGLVYLAGWLQQGRKKGNAILGGVSLLSGFLAGGKAGAFGAAVAIVVFLLVGWQNLRMWIRALVLILLVGFALLAFGPPSEVGFFAHLAFYQELRLGTLHTRFDLWDGGIRLWLSSPWSALIGQGFTATRVAGITSASGEWTTTHAHNSLVQALVELGILGTLPLIAAMLNPVAKFIRQYKSLARSPLLPIFVGLIVLMVGSLTDDVYGGLLHPPFYLLIGLVATIDGACTGPEKRLPTKWR